MGKNQRRKWIARRGRIPKIDTSQRREHWGADEGPNFSLAELVPGEVALCIQQGEKLYAVIEHLEPAQAVQTLKDVLTGQVSPDELSAHEWREVDVKATRFKGIEKLELPPLKDWPR
jgi:hypothetical protein